MKHKNYFILAKRMKEREANGKHKNQVEVVEDRKASSEKKSVKPKKVIEGDTKPKKGIKED